MEKIEQKFKEIFNKEDKTIFLINALLFPGCRL